MSIGLWILHAKPHPVHVGIRQQSTSTPVLSLIQVFALEPSGFMFIHCHKAIHFAVKKRAVLVGVTLQTAVSLSRKVHWALQLKRAVPLKEQITDGLHFFFKMPLHPCPLCCSLFISSIDHHEMRDIDKVHFLDVPRVAFLATLSRTLAKSSWQYKRRLGNTSYLQHILPRNDPPPVCIPLNCSSPQGRWLSGPDMGN